MEEQPKNNSQESAKPAEENNTQATKQKRAQIGVGKKALVVDDDPTTLKLIEELLKKVGFEVIIAVHGQQGLDLVKKGNPALIITDIIMPEMDGFSFYKELKNDDSTKNIPFLVVTARGKMEDSFMALGVDGFIAKPIDTEDFLNKICGLSLKSADSPSDKAESKDQQE